jgi:hypothetical protein
MKLLTKLTMSLPALLISATGQALVIEHSADFTSNNLNTHSVTTDFFSGGNATEKTNINLSRFDSSLGVLTGVDISFTSHWEHTSYASATDTIAELAEPIPEPIPGPIPEPGPGPGPGPGPIPGPEPEPGPGPKDPNPGPKKRSALPIFSASNDTSVSSSSSANFAVELLDPISTSMSSSNLHSVDCMETNKIGLEVNCSDSASSSNAFDGLLNLSAFSLDDFIGISDLLLAFTNTTSLSGTCDNNDLGDECTAYNEAFWSGSVSVSYTYNAPPTQAVSEPSPLFLLGAGLFCLGLIRKRSK